MKKNLFIIGILIFTGTFVDAQKIKPVKLLDATVEPHVGGVMGSPQQQVYSLKLFVKALSNVVFDTLWIKQAAMPIKNRRENGDTVLLSAVYSRIDPEFLRKNNRPIPPDNVKAPKRLEGQALLGYKIKRKKYFLQVKEFRKLAVVAYPSAPPMQNH